MPSQPSIRFSARPGPCLLTLLPALLICGPSLLIPQQAAGQQQQAKRAAPAPEQSAYDNEIRPLLQQFCGGCHGPQSPSGGIDLTGRYTGDVRILQRDQATWRKAVVQIRERAMPPRGTPQPTSEQRERLAFWLASALDNADDSLFPRDPGHAIMRRLSRAEYNNTVRDLFGVTSRPADTFPPDGGGGAGFDNNADTLFVPPILMERYLEAATAVLDEAKPERVFIVRPSAKQPARAAAKQIIAHHAFRAFRRPVEQAEIARLMRLYDSAAKRGTGFESAVKTALKAVLISPSFLFRMEGNTNGSGGKGSAAKQYPVGDYELASRLSYFLWASMPDAELFRLARDKRLRHPAVLEKQVRRMIQDPKARSFADTFVGQWLRTRDLNTAAQPDPRRYPEFSPRLRDAMYQEVSAFFDSVLRNNASLLRLIDADYTFLNEDLAKHYGIPNVNGPQMRRVALTDRRRGGVVTMAGVLTVTSYPQRTSPVLRGKWVLEEMLGTPAPPPPPNAGGLPADDATNKEGLTFRKRLELHREKPECNSCHSRMDPLGFGLENFDAIGRWRDSISGTPVDAAGILETGEKFTGPVELKRHLLTRKDDFLRNVTEKMLSYALGRGLQPNDIPTVRRIMSAVKKDNYRSATLILEIVKSYPFQYRKDG